MLWLNKFIRQFSDRIRQLRMDNRQFRFDNRQLEIFISTLNSIIVNLLNIRQFNFLIANLLGYYPICSPISGT